MRSSRRTSLHFLLLGLAAAAVMISSPADAGRRKEKRERREAERAREWRASTPYYAGERTKPDPSPSGMVGPYDNYTKVRNPFDMRATGEGLR